MRLILFFLCTIFSGVLLSQTKADFSEVDKKVKNIPDSIRKATSSLATYIKSNFSSESDQIRAIFIWTTTNISYDIENMYAINFNETSQDKIKKAMETKKGVCINYAEVFNELANKIGIRSYVIEGFTKQSGFTDYIPHAWCGAKIDSSWFVFDPTWGSGYIQNNKFVRKINEAYFKSEPSKIIASHMPFDYLWQFLNYPITNQEFYEGKIAINEAKRFFDFEKAIDEYESAPELQKLKYSAERIEKNGIKNSMIFDRLAYKKREIEIIKQNKLASDFSKVVAKYNEGINDLNKFINFRNNQFKPVVPDDEIRGMIEICKEKLILSQNMINGLGEVDELNKENVNSVKVAIDDAIKQASEQEAFVKEYLSKGKMGRKSMFTKVTWFGIPIN